jgi:hypothetical protein
MFRPERKIAQTGLKSKSSRSLDRTDCLQTGMNSEEDACKHKYISDRSWLCSWLPNKACSQKKKMVDRGINWKTCDIRTGLTWTYWKCWFSSGFEFVPVSCRRSLSTAQSTSTNCSPFHLWSQPTLFVPVPQDHPSIKEDNTSVVINLNSRKENRKQESKEEGNPEAISQIIYYWSLSSRVARSSYIACWSLEENVKISSNENEKTREFASESFITSPLMPRSNENKSCMRVDESWQARVYLHESFLNSHVPVKREQDLHES